MSILDIGASGLRAAYAQLQTTSNNIANASTPGYSRQEVVLQSAGSNFNGGGFMGRGVDVVTVQRRYDDYLAREVHLASSSESADAARSNALGRLDRLFSDSANGISVAYDDLGAGLADLANRPFDSAARSVVSQRATVLAQRIAVSDDRIQQIGTDTDRELGQQAIELNQKLSELAALNNRLASMGGSSHQPTDMLDRRDQLVTSINQHVRANVYINSDQTASLYAGSGDALVLGSTASKIAIAADPENPNQARMLLVTDQLSIPMNDTMLGGGSISGMLKFRNEDLQQARWRVGQMAGGLADAMNRQQALGVDLNGNAGAAVFEPGQISTLASGANAGNAELSVSLVDGSSLAASDYQITFDGAQYTMKRLSDGVETNFAGFPQQIDGLSINVASGAFAAGDRIVLTSGSSLAGGFRMILGGASQWAAAAPVTPTAAAGNQGSLAVEDFAVTNHDAATLAPVSLTFTGAGSFDVSGAGTGDPTGQVYTSGQAISYNGWSISLRGQPAAGDVFTISPPSDPGGNNGNALRLLELSDAGIVGGDSLTGAFSNLVADVGSRAQAANASQQASASWRNGASAAMDEVSGVNLDEEAARLIEFQQAYQAAAKVIQTGQQMFDALIAATSR